jgi:hypothetical protein
MSFPAFLNKFPVAQLFLCSLFLLPSGTFLAVLHKSKMEELMQEFVVNGLEYLNAKNKQKVNDWESYQQYVLQNVEKSNGFHYGFYTCQAILKQYGQDNGIKNEIYFLAAQSLKTICCKRELSHEYLIELIHLLKFFLSEKHFPSQNPIVTQLVLSLAGLFFHSMVQRVSSHHLSSYSELISKELISFFQEMIFPCFLSNSVTSGHSASSVEIVFLILQSISELFPQKELKFWISYKGSEKSEILKYIQISLLEVSSIIIPWFMKHFLGDSQGTGLEIELLSLNLLQEWLKNLNSLDIFTVPSGSSPSSATSVISFHSSHQILSFWMKNPFLENVFQRIQSKDNSSADETLEEIKNISLDVLMNLFEFYHAILKHTVFQLLFITSREHPLFSSLEENIGKFVQLIHYFSEVLE